jgi:hypothetical protein
VQQTKLLLQTHVAKTKQAVILLDGLIATMVLLVWLTFLLQEIRISWIASILLVAIDKEHVFFAFVPH